MPRVAKALYFEVLLCFPMAVFVQVVLASTAWGQGLEGRAPYSQAPQGNRWQGAARRGQDAKNTIWSRNRQSFVGFVILHPSVLKRLNHFRCQKP